MLPENINEVAALVRAVADRELPSRFACQCGSKKADGSLVTEADIVMQEALVQALQQRWPSIGVVGEEMDAATQQQAMAHEQQGLWCIDPLDGTSNFSAGIPYYAVSVALLCGDEVRLGVVYDPSRQECFTAMRGRGAWLNDEPLRRREDALPLSQAMALVDLKRLSAELAGRLAAEPPYQSQRSFGAVALDWCWLAAGRCDVYLHGRQKLWDYAAGSLILQEAGGHAVTLQGDSVFVPTLEPRSAAAALDADLFRQWTDWLGITPTRKGD